MQHFLETFISIFPDSEIHVFGDGEARTSFKQWVSHKKYANAVVFKGHFDFLDSELKEGYEGVAGMGRVVLEGGALGLPVILVGYDGVKGLIRRDQEKTFLVAGLRQLPPMNFRHKC